MTLHSVVITDDIRMKRRRQRVDSDAGDGGNDCDDINGVDGEKNVTYELQEVDGGSCYTLCVSS